MFKIKVFLGHVFSICFCTYTRIVKLMMIKKDGLTLEICIPNNLPSDFFVVMPIFR